MPEINQYFVKMHVTNLFQFIASLFVGIDKGYGKNSKISHF
jgi:hypothetical protein